MSKLILHSLAVKAGVRLSLLVEEELQSSRATLPRCTSKHHLTSCCISLARICKELDVGLKPNMAT